jgi:hypothetical protein
MARRRGDAARADAPSLEELRVYQLLVAESPEAPAHIPFERTERFGHATQNDSRYSSRASKKDRRTSDSAILRPAHASVVDLVTLTELRVAPQVVLHDRVSGPRATSYHCCQDARPVSTVPAAEEKRQTPLGDGAQHTREGITVSGARPHGSCASCALPARRTHRCGRSETRWQDPEHGVVRTTRSVRQRRDEALLRAALPALAEVVHDADTGLMQ